MQSLRRLPAGLPHAQHLQRRARVRSRHRHLHRLPALRARVPGGCGGESDFAEEEKEIGAGAEPRAVRFLREIFLAWPPHVS